jgi:hypothetical protein
VVCATGIADATTAADVTIELGTGSLTFDDTASGSLSFSITALLSSGGTETVRVGLSAPTVDAGSASITSGQDVATAELTDPD